MPRALTKCNRSAFTPDVSEYLRGRVCDSGYPYVNPSGAACDFGRIAKDRSFYILFSHDMDVPHVKGLFALSGRFRALVFVGIVVLMLGGLVGVSFAEGVIRLVVNGTPISSDVPLTLVNGRTMAPVRVVSEALGAQVTWDEENQQVLVYRQNATGTQEGKTAALANTEPDNIYWTFSAAAQALAAVIAFLLAGYTLVHSMMESKAASDETLVEVNDKLSQDYHTGLTILIIVTVGAILADLLVVYFNTSGAPWWPQVGAGVLTFIAFVGAVFFVITIVDPRKYKRAARNLAHRPSVQAQDSKVPAVDFFKEYVPIEQLLRRLWRFRAHGERLSRRPGPVSAREMLDVLRLEILPEDLAGTLYSLVKIRNLVVHGEIEQVDSDQVENARSAKERLERLILGEVVTVLDRMGYRDGRDFTTRDGQIHNLVVHQEDIPRIREALPKPWLVAEAGQNLQEGTVELRITLATDQDIYGSPSAS